MSDGYDRIPPAVLGDNEPEDPEWDPGEGTDGLDLPPDPVFDWEGGQRGTNS